MDCSNQDPKTSSLLPNLITQKQMCLAQIQNQKVLTHLLASEFLLHHKSFLSYLLVLIKQWLMYPLLIPEGFLVQIMFLALLQFLKLQPLHPKAIPIILFLRLLLGLLLSVPSPLLIQHEIQSILTFHELHFLHLHSQVSHYHLHEILPAQACLDHHQNAWPLLLFCLQ